MLRRALINTHLGDAHFWKHPESTAHNIVWTSTCREWLEWKRENIVPESHRLSIRTIRKAGAEGCYPNAKTLYGMKCRADQEISRWKDLSKEEVLHKMDLLDVAIWFLDDGSAVAIKRNGHVSTWHITISVGPLTDERLFPPMQRLFGTERVGSVHRNNSKASERNKTWYLTKPVAVQVLAQARNIAPSAMQYKTPLW